MKITKISISKIKLNPDNPRIIKNDKFKILVKSIKEFPKMLEIRPVVINKDMMILGGNQRLKACKEAGLKEIPVIFAESLTKSEQKEFIIKDNIESGEFDFNLLKGQFSIDELQTWGIEGTELNKKITNSHIQEEALRPYTKTHILISFPPDKFLEIENLLQTIRTIEGIEIEQSSN
jgi:hypothetical protein